jgi:hypothetical protein
MQAGYQDKSSGYFTALRREMLPYVPADTRVTLASANRSGAA